MIHQRELHPFKVTVSWGISSRRISGLLLWRCHREISKCYTREILRNVDKLCASNHMEYTKKVVGERSHIRPENFPSAKDDFSKYSRAPIIQTDWETRPFRLIKNLDKWTSLKNGYGNVQVPFTLFSRLRTGSCNSANFSILQMASYEVSYKTQATVI